MTDKEKKPQRKPADHSHAAASAEDAGTGTRSSTHARQLHEQAPRGLPYRKDPDYRKLLEHFQSAEWNHCLEKIDHLLKSYPDDEHLLAFKQDVQMRSAHQQQSERQQESDDRHQRRRVRTRALIAALSAVVLLGILVWFVSAYQAEQTRQRLAAEATQTAVSVAAQDQIADALMKAGKADQALALYVQIQKTDPAFAGIDRDIAAAQLAVRVEGLYQTGIRLIESGEAESALASLQEADELLPNYKDTPQLIAKIVRDQKIASLVESIHDAYHQGDSAAVVEAYEAIQSTDPLAELPNLDEELFASYEDLVLQIAAKRDPTLEEIQAAARYYRNALALFPQSIEYSRERAELQEVAVELLASQFYLQGISLLESSDYSIEGLQQSILVLQRAREKTPESPAVDSAIEKSQLFIDSYENIVHGGWDDAITGFEDLYRRDPNFADGRVRYFLYEAYTSRGDLLMLNADFGGAFADYQAAEKYAWADEQNVMRIFQIELRIANALHKLGKDDQAGEFYRFAFEQPAYQKLLKLPEHKSLQGILEKAQAAHAEGNEVESIAFYAELSQHADELYELKTITVRRGETLPNLAFEQGSTLASLRSANELGDSLIINRTQPLSVPILP